MQKLCWLKVDRSIICNASAQETPPCTWAELFIWARCSDIRVFGPGGRFFGPTSPRRETSLLNLAGFLTRLFFFVQFPVNIRSLRSSTCMHSLEKNNILSSQNVFSVQQFARNSLEIHEPS